VNVLRLLLGHDVDDVVDGDDAEEGATAVDHGNGLHVILRHELGDLLLVGLGRDGDQVLGHDLFDALLGVRKEDVTQRSDADESLLGVDDVQVVDELDVLSLAAHLLDRIVGRRFAMGLDVIGGHEVAGAGLGPTRQLLDLLGGLRVVPLERFEQLLTHVVG
jgi:hypothetical protein